MNKDAPVDKLVQNVTADGSHLARVNRSQTSTARACFARIESLAQSRRAKRDWTVRDQSLVSLICELPSMGEQRNVQIHDSSFTLVRVQPYVIASGNRDLCIHRVDADATSKYRSETFREPKWINRQIRNSVKDFWEPLSVTF